MGTAGVRRVLVGVLVGLGVIAMLAGGAMLIGALGAPGAGISGALGLPPRRQTACRVAAAPAGPAALAANSSAASRGGSGGRRRSRVVQCQQRPAPWPDLGAVHGAGAAAARALHRVAHDLW
ncbi:MAG TPA: hypothetical protein VFA70_00035 [Dehalococcoidia bacterium]|nr:hypothetical protein [Dehalococcoidia bacterium]